MITYIVMMPGKDHQAICDAVRAKTGGTKKGVGYSNNQNGTTVHRRLILVTITDAACKISIK